MQRHNEVHNLTKTSIPERLGDILPAVIDRIADRRVAATCQHVGPDFRHEQPQQKASKLAACG